MVSTADVQQSLGGIDYPADKGKLVNYAKQHGGSNDIVNALNKLPGDKEFHDAADVNEALGKSM